MIEPRLRFSNRTIAMPEAPRSLAQTGSILALRLAPTGVPTLDPPTLEPAIDKGSFSSQMTISKSQAPRATASAHQVLAVRLQLTADMPTLIAADRLTGECLTLFSNGAMSVPASPSAVTQTVQISGLRRELPVCVPPTPRGVSATSDEESFRGECAIRMHCGPNAFA